MKDISSMVGKIVRHIKTKSVGRCVCAYPKWEGWIVVDWIDKGERWPASYMVRANNIEIVRRKKSNGKEKDES